MRLLTEDEFTLPNRNINGPEDIKQPDPTFWEYAGDIAAAPFRGVEQAAKSLYNLTDWATLDLLPDYDETFLGESKTTAGKLISGFSQFAAGFIPVVGQVGKLGKLAGLSGKSLKFFQGTAAGAVTDFTAFDAQEERLSNLIQEFPSLANPITEYLAADGDDGEIEGRLKNVAEGLGLDIGVGVLMTSLKGLRGSRKAIAEGATPEEAAEAAAKEMGTGVEELVKLGDELTHDPDELVRLRSEGKLSLKQEAEKAIDNEHGLLNKDIINGSDDLDLYLTEKVNIAKASKDGTRRQKIEETLVRAVGLSKQYGFDDLNVEQKIAEFRRGALQTEEGSLKAILAIDELPKQFEEAQVLLKKAVETGSNTDMLKAKDAINFLGDLHRVIAGQGTAQGRALRSRRYIKEKQLENIEQVQELIEEAGGNQHLLSALKRFNEATNPAAFMKVVKNQESQSGRLLRAHNELWMNSILSGPRTFMVNLLSTGINTFYRPFEGAVGGLFEGDLGAANSFIRQGFTMFTQIQDSARIAMRSFLEDSNLLDANARVSDVIGRRGIDESETLKGPLKYNGRHAINGDSNWLKGFGAVINIPNRMLMSTDEFFKQLNYRSHAKTRLVEEGISKGLRGEKLTEFVNNTLERVVTKGGRKFSEAAITREAFELANAEGLTGSAKSEFVSDFVKKNFKDVAGAYPELLNIANRSQEFARTTTFTNPLEQGTIGKSLQNAVIKAPVLQLVMPFVTTPVNLMKFAGQRIFPSKLFPMHKKFIEEINHADPLIRAQARGRQVVGTGIIFSALGLVNNGIITGRGPTDPDERRILEATGWQPYSINIGGTYISYQRFDPFSTLFGSVSDLNESFTNSDIKDVDRIGAAFEAMQTAMSSNIFNKSYLTGVQRVLEALNQTETGKLEALTKAQLVSYIPNFITQVAPSITGEDYMKDAQSLVEVALRKAGATAYLEPVRNALGEKVEARRYLLNNAISPAMLSRDKDDEVMKALAELKHGFQRPSNLLDNNTVDMKEFKNDKGRSSYDYFLSEFSTVKVGGKTMRQSLKRLIKSNYYERLSADSAGEGQVSPRISEVRKVMNRYKKVAMQNTYKKYPELERTRAKFKLEKNLLRQGKTIEQIQALTSLY